MEHSIHDSQPFLAVQGRSDNAKPFEIVDDVQFDSFQAGLRCFDIVSVDAKRDVLAFRKAVVAFLKLVLKHGGIFFPDMVEVIFLGRNEHTLLKCVQTDSKVVEGKLNRDRWIEIIEEVTPSAENRRLIFVLRELIIDILEFYSFGVMVIVNEAYAVRPHSLIRNRLLGRVRNTAPLIYISNDGVQLLLFCPGQLDFARITGL